MKTLCLEKLGRAKSTRRPANYADRVRDRRVTSAALHYMIRVVSAVGLIAALADAVGR